MGSTTQRPRADGAPLGPGSLLWSIAGDPRGLLTGSAAGIMQLMLPGLGAGVSDHSNFFDDPYDRIFRSIPYIWGSIFADDAEGTEMGHRIRDFHPDIKGTDHHGNRYHALDPDVFWWAHATFTWEFFRAQQLYFARRLTRAEQEQLYAETVTWYRRYGVSDRPVPATLDDFRGRFEEPTGPGSLLCAGRCRRWNRRSAGVRCRSSGPRAPRTWIRRTRPGWWSPRRTPASASVDRG